MRFLFQITNEKCKLTIKEKNTIKNLKKKNPLLIKYLKCYKNGLKSKLQITLGSRWPVKNFKNIYLQLHFHLHYFSYYSLYPLITVCYMNLGKKLMASFFCDLQFHFHLHYFSCYSLYPLITVCYTNLWKKLMSSFFCDLQFHFLFQFLFL